MSPGDRLFYHMAHKEAGKTLYERYYLCTVVKVSEKYVTVLVDGTDRPKPVKRENLHETRPDVILDQRAHVIGPSSVGSRKRPPR